jgi:hypothetical protein
MSVRTALAARALTGLGLAGDAIASAASASAGRKAPRSAARPAVLALPAPRHVTGAPAAVI